MNGQGGMSLLPGLPENRRHAAAYTFKQVSALTVPMPDVLVHRACKLMAQAFLAALLR